MKTKDILLILLSMVVVYLLVKPKPVENNHYQQEMKESQHREDSLVNIINNLQSIKYELKDSIKEVDTTYSNLDKPKVRERSNRLFDLHNIR